MSDARARPFSAPLGAASLLCLVLGAAFVAGCSAPQADEAVAQAEGELGETATLRFDAGAAPRVTGSLAKGSKVRVVYDDARLASCRGEQGGVPQWAITGYVRVGQGPVRTFPVAGLGASGAPTIALDASGELQLWFQSTSRWGCNAWDSDFGQNYRFRVTPKANEPGWLGGARYAIDRRTCEGGYCESALREVPGEIVYDSWARQRAAVRVLVFEAWKAGVTDFDNADLWKQLDVQVHARVEGTSAFTTSYVKIDRRAGNNARYAVDLTAIDPIPGHVAAQTRQDCPVYPMREVAGSNGTMVEATVELYVTVNGAELRPAGEGATDSFYRVRYQNYADRFAACVAHP